MQPPEREYVRTHHPAGTQTNNKPEDRDSVDINQRSKNPVNVDLWNQPGTSNAALSPHADIFEPVLPATNLGSELQLLPTEYSSSITEVRPVLLPLPI